MTEAESIQPCPDESVAVPSVTETCQPEITVPGEPAASAAPPVSAPARRTVLSLGLNIGVSMAVLAASIFGYTFLGERKRPQRKRPPKSDVTEVVSQPLRVHNGAVQIAANGVIVPLREIRLATEVAGRIVEQSENLRPGQMVEKGEVLIRLDAVEHELEVKRLRAQQRQEIAELAAADVSIASTEQLAELASQQLKITSAEKARVDSLANKRVISQSEADIARRTELTARSSFVELENRRKELASMRQLVVEKQALTAVLLERAELEVARCVVRSPVRGRVVQSTVEEQSFVPAGTPFVTIEDTSAVEVRSSLTADQMVWVWSSVGHMPATGSIPDSTTTFRPLLERPETPKETGFHNKVPPVPATITYQIGGQLLTSPAVLHRIDGAGINVQTRTYPCLFRIAAQDAMDADATAQRLTRGMFVGVEIETHPDRLLFQVPEAAIRPGNRIWLNENGQLRIVQVTVVSRSAGSLTVEFKPGAISPEALPNIELILSPVSNPIEGMKVSSRPSAIPSARASR